MRSMDTMDNGYCTILTKDRIYQGIALWHSLQQHAEEYTMFVLCMDDTAYHVLSKLQTDKIVLVPKAVVENYCPNVKGLPRKTNEYCWTLKPIFLEYLFNHYPNIARITYVDSDIYFFDDPTVIFKHQSASNVLLSKHDFDHGNVEAEGACGKYNSGFISFKRSKAAQDCLAWWKDRCIEWCYDRSEPDRFGDQKYVEFFPRMFEGVDEISTPGVNIATWNHSKYQFKMKENNVYINDDRLICYHYCGFRIINKNEFALIIGDKRYIAIIHQPYMSILKNIMSWVQKIAPGYQGYYIEQRFRSAALRIFPGSTVQTPFGQFMNINELAKESQRR
ncbi:MAG: hypothetical protein ACOYVK_20165 [Bacillota bacterium]